MGAPHSVWHPAVAEEELRAQNQCPGRPASAIK